MDLFPMNAVTAVPAESPNLWMSPLLLPMETLVSPLILAEELVLILQQVVLTLVTSFTESNAGDPHLVLSSATAMKSQLQWDMMLLEHSVRCYPIAISLMKNVPAMPMYSKIVDATELVPHPQAMVKSNHFTS